MPSLSPFFTAAKRCPCLLSPPAVTQTRPVLRQNFGAAPLLPFICFAASPVSISFKVHFEPCCASLFPLQPPEGNACL